MKLKSIDCALWVILLVLCSLTACVNASHEQSVSLAASTLWQPPVLRLTAGQTVQTLDGAYSVSRPEVWHSDARFRQMEQENINLAAALAAKNGWMAPPDYTNRRPIDAILTPKSEPVTTSNR